jgi:hypothetical protein
MFLHARLACSPQLGSKFQSSARDAPESALVTCPLVGAERLTDLREINEPNYPEYNDHAGDGEAKDVTDIVPRNALTCALRRNDRALIRILKSVHSWFSALWLHSEPIVDVLAHKILGQTA